MYTPTKAAFDGAIPFLWLMAVSTTACAAVWTNVVVGEEVTKQKKKQSLRPQIQLSIDLK
jgi:signal peptide peptidase-like protein 2B